MTPNEIVGRLKAGGLDASSTNRSAAVYVTEARSGRAEPGWFGFRIVCDSEDTERRARAILSRWYDIEAGGNVWRLRSKNRVPLMAIKRGGVPPTPPTPTSDYMYFEAVDAGAGFNFYASKSFDLEYSRDMVTWEKLEFPGGTSPSIILSEIGDKVWIRGNNPEGFGKDGGYLNTVFVPGKQIKAGGCICSLLSKNPESVTRIPDNAFINLLNGCSGLVGAAPTFGNVERIGINSCMSMYSSTGITQAADMSKIKVIEQEGCVFMYAYNPDTRPANMGNIETLGEASISGMYSCNFHAEWFISDGQLVFDFPTPPVMIGNYEASTADDVVSTMTWCD